MGELLSWNDDMSVSVTSIDDQHKRLIALINELHDAMAVGKSNDVMGHLLDELIDYTGYHFQHEQTLMQEHGYPDYEGHKAEHDELVKTVVELQQKFRAGRTRMSFEVMTFLKGWLQGHIMGTDMKLGAFLSSKEAE